MSEFTFTPGPWKVMQLPGGVVGVGDHQDLAIAIVPNWMGERPSEPNARLMAAAPSLLAACEEARRLFAYHCEYRGTDIEREWYQQVRAAIAKATGPAVQS